MQHHPPSALVTGSEALAYGALDAGVRRVTGYPGSPATPTVEALLRLTDSGIQVDWATNEKSAFDSAFGASLAGIRSLVCVKSVGLNVALDSLMVANLASGDGGFVILVGDDPGGWGSQNEQDSRPLIASAEVPMMEPISVADARSAMAQAFELSEVYRVPVAVRITRAFAVGRDHMPLKDPRPPRAERASFRRQEDRYCVLPVRVVELHRRLQAMHGEIRDRFEDSPRNRCQGGGDVGCIAAGFAWQKLRALAGRDGHWALNTLGLGTLNPLPERAIAGFLERLHTLLVLEDGGPFVETQIRALAQSLGHKLSVLGRRTGHLPSTGELLGPQLSQALGKLTGSPPTDDGDEAWRERPSRRALCVGCPYVPTFRALVAAMEEHGGREAFIVTGEPGCMIRGQLPPFELLDVKYGLGSSIGLGAGLARSGVSQQIVALSGDSSLLHSGLAELIDACQADIQMAIVVLANETTALSGGQPHPGTGLDARGRRRTPVDLRALVKAAGAGLTLVVDPENREALAAALEETLAYPGVAVLITKRGCPHAVPNV